jgi:hypothetical protein
LTRSGVNPTRGSWLERRVDRPRSRRCPLTVLLLLLAALTACASASTTPPAAGEPNIRVAPTGSDSTCTRGAGSRPCRSLDHAYSLAHPGDTIAIGAGTYPGQTISQSTANGKPGTTPVTIEPDAGATVVVNGYIAIGASNTTRPVSYLTVDGRDRLTVNGGLVIGFQGSHDTFTNIHVQNNRNFAGGPLVAIDDASYASIVDNNIGPMCCDGDGVEIRVRNAGDPSSDNVTAAGNNIHDLYQSCQEWPSSLGACNAIGFGDSEARTTLAADLSADASTLTVSSGFSWLSGLAASGGYFYVTIDSETLEVRGDASGTTWTIKRPGNCDELNASAVCAGIPAPHAVGATVAITNAFYDHVDGIQAFGCRTCAFERNKIYLQGATKQGLFLQPANGGSFSNLTIVNNMLCCGGNTLAPVSAPGLDVFSGYVNILYNTVVGPLLLYDSVLVAGTTVTIVGNIITGQAGNSNAGGCTVAAGDRSTLTPTWSHNLMGTRLRCGPGDFGGRATFVRAGFAGGQNPDLHLLGTAGLGRGDPSLHPKIDIDGHLRPVLLAPDVGASQQETALIVPGRSIGAVRLGETEAEVEASYGAKNPKRNAEGASVATYRIHQGSLAVTYDDSGRVVGVRTTSRYYSSPTGLIVGSTLPSTALSVLNCPGYWRFPGSAGLFLTGTSRRTPSLASIAVFARKFAPC